jgi:hypothetical protein
MEATTPGRTLQRHRRRRPCPPSSNLMLRRAHTSAAMDRAKRCQATWQNYPPFHFARRTGIAQQKQRTGKTPQSNLEKLKQFITQD